MEARPRMNGMPFLSSNPTEIILSGPQSTSEVQIDFTDGHSLASEPYHYMHETSENPGSLPVPTSMVRMETPSSEVPLPSAGEQEIVCQTCATHFEGEYARGNHARHMMTMHSDKLYSCKVEGCGAIFKRSDYRLRHYRRAHPELDVPSHLRRR